MRHLLILLALAAACRLGAHPEIEEALVRLNDLITAAPRNASLHLQRGELQLQHNNLLGADFDFRRAAMLSPGLPRLERARGALAIEKGQFEEARAYFDRAMQQDPKDAEAMVMRSRVLAALGEKTAALADLTAALAIIPVPSPDLYLVRADLFPDPRDAVRSIDEGIERLGQVPSLVARALALEQSAGRVESALTRVDQILATTERRETWLKTRGDLLAQAKRPREAHAAYVAASAALAALPDWLRTSPDNLQLAAELDRLVAAHSPN